MCPTHLHFAKLICGRWLAQNLRESLQNSPGTAYCTEGSKAKYEDMKGLLMTHHLLRLLWYPVYEWEWVDENPAATCWTRTIKFTLFPSPLGEPGMSLPVCRYCLCCGDYRCSVKNSGDRMTKVNKDMKPQVRLTYTQSLVFLTPSSCWNWSAAHLIFHSDCCWQKTQGASSRCLSDNPLSGGGMFVWGWRAWDRGINVEHRYPDTSGRCLLWSCFSCFEIFCECTSLSQKHE